MGIGERLRILRERAGLTQEELAREYNTKQSTVSGWETERRGFQANELPKLARLLKAHPCEFYEGWGDWGPYCSPEYQFPPEEVPAGLTLADYTTLRIIVSRLGRLPDERRELAERILSVLAEDQSPAVRRNSPK